MKIDTLEARLEEHRKAARAPWMKHCCGTFHVYPTDSRAGVCSLCRHTKEQHAARTLYYPTGQALTELTRLRGEVERLAVTAGLRKRLRDVGPYIASIAPDNSESNGEALEHIRSVREALTELQRLAGHGS